MLSGARSLAVLALVMVTGACSAGNRQRTPSPAAGPPPALVVVAASDAVGFGAANPATEAWPEVLVKDALPKGTELVNLGIPGATVRTANERELPAALQRRSSLVAVWLNVNDLVSGVPVERYEEQLGQLLGALRAGGSARVVVANTPPLDQAPAYLACLQPSQRCLLATSALPTPAAVQNAVDAYNAAIARVAQKTGAEVVDLHAAGLAARAAGTEASHFGPDGFHPSTAGHRAVAEAFAKVITAK